MMRGLIDRAWVAKSGYYGRLCEDNASGWALVGFDEGRKRRVHEVAL